MDLDAQLRQFKDFLQLYNIITERCFTSCVDGFFTREVENQEDFCVRNCVDKYANTNQLIMKTYVEVQGKINEKRMEEFTKQQQELLEKQAQEQQIDVNSPIIQSEEKPAT
ncbi:unnamed protein product [Chironomus riparius]|uniref:Mitochondrial import inner membrane translocase subunit n=1 Tax=Chironomus riparius TaxID=315576 RepID=A0A9N9S4Z1_9DIPT|nr:unnamed protein product [Chironomus riparius]